MTTNWGKEELKENQDRKLEQEVHEQNRGWMKIAKENAEENGNA